MTNRQSTELIFSIVILGSAFSAFQTAPARLHSSGISAQQTLRKELPKPINAKAKYLFYLHGRIIENQGIHAVDPRFGTYEYEKILKTFEDKGFITVSEARAKDTDPKRYAPKIVTQITSLISAGVPSQHITVVGASKGAVIAMLVSTFLRNKDVNFVLMSNCNDSVYQNFKPDLYGNVLSIYDMNDEFGGSCQKFFDKSAGINRHKEVKLRIGTGHAILYKPLPEWVDLVVDWAKEN